jgi:hypothetical protein
MPSLKPKKLSKTQQAEFDAYMGILMAGKEAGCPQDQMDNFQKAGIVLQPKQLSFCAAARLCDIEGGPTGIMAGGGRGGSKTFALWAQLWCDDCQRFPGLKGLILRKVGKANKEQINDYRGRLLRGLEHNYRQQDGEILFANGSKVLVGNFKDEKDIDKYLGQEYDVICISESNQLTFTKKKFILTCLRTSKAGWRPRVYEDTNPGGVGMAENKKIYYEPWKKQCERETRYIHFTVHDNKFVNREYVEQLETLTGWQRKAWLFGDWEFAAGAFFTNFLPDIHVYPRPINAAEKAKYIVDGKAITIPDQFDFQDKDFIRWFLAYDFGFAHNAAAVLCGETRGRITCFVDEYCESEQVISEQAENIKYMVKRHGLEWEDLDFAVAGKDCFNRNEDGKTIAQLFEAEGLFFEQADMDRINGWKRMHALFGDISANIQPKGYVHSRCVNLIDQIGKAQHSIKRPGDIEKFNASPETGEGGDDVLDSARFICASDPSIALQWATPLNLTTFQPAILQLNVG